MALGKTHDFVNLMFLPASLYFVPKDFFLPFTAGYLIGTFLLSPDLDMKNSKPSKRWKVFRFIWYPYQAKSKHRGISHIPIVGTFVRLFYFNLVVVFFYTLFSFSVRNYLPEYTDLANYLNPIEHLESFGKSQSSFYFLLGLIISEVFHLALDVFSSVFRGKKGRKK